MVQTSKKLWVKPMVHTLSIKAETTKGISKGKSESYGAKYPGPYDGPVTS